MKVVLDTNVFVSGVFFSGPPFQILKAWSGGRIQLVVSPEIIDEYRRVGEILAADHPSIEFTPVLEYVLQNAEYRCRPMSISANGKLNGGIMSFTVFRFPHHNNPYVS